MSTAKLLETLRKTGWRVATAESCTGGMLGAALTDIAGSSDVYEGGFITYSNAAKRTELGVTRYSLTRFGAVSEQVAGEMAQGALRRLGVDLAISITGIAGPGGSEAKPEGRVCFGVATKDKTTSETVEFGPLGRSNVRAKATDHALGLILNAVGE